MTPLTYFLNYLLLVAFLTPSKAPFQEFQGKAYYYAKSNLQLGAFGARMSAIQKKQIQEGLKNRLEKTYILSFTKEASSYKEEVKLDAISGATDSWGANFTPGELYKNIKTKRLIQEQEFYGKQFLIHDELIPIEWIMTSEQKNIGKYTCFKAKASIPTALLSWYNFSWNETNTDEDEAPKTTTMTEVIAWYTPQIPISHGPSEFWGLPGLILEINTDTTILLCSKIVLNPDESIKLSAPKKGKQVNKSAYKEIITGKMLEMRNNRTRSRRE
ncbi:GLPGLI family protein [Flavobacteriaceae bacterium F08102]|nr:GLPGLI family protein [Flavobacteriaceae bacterium F08102]